MHVKIYCVVHLRFVRGTIKILYVIIHKNEGKLSIRVEGMHKSLKSCNFNTSILFTEFSKF